MEVLVKEAETSSNLNGSGASLSFRVEKEVLLNGLKTAERATAQKGLQPVLANILFESDGNSKINLSATDFDLTIITSIEAQVISSGAITLSAKKLLDIVTRLNDGIINFELNNTIMTITSGKSKFDIIGIAAAEFPQLETVAAGSDYIEVDLKPFITGIKETSFAAAAYESNNNLLSGVVCDISDKVFEMASTDGNRLARTKKIISNDAGKAQKLIIPAKVLQEFLKIAYFIEDDSVKIYSMNNKIMIKSDKVSIISNLMNGQYPPYNQLIPQSFRNEAKINVSKLVSAIERVSTMVNEKTSIIKLEFSQNSLNLKADAPETGNSEEQLDISYNNDDIVIAFNYRYLLDCFKNIESESLIIDMNTNLSAAVIKPDNNEDFIYLVMPVQIR